MPRDYETPTRDILLAWLESDGPLTCAELSQLTGIPSKKVSSCITHARHSHGTKYFRIESYERQVGVGGREAPRYTIGPAPDARRPAMNTVADKRKIQERHREKHRVLLRLKQRKREGKVASNIFFDTLGVHL